MSDKSDYVNDGGRGRDPREGFGDDGGARVGRPDGAGSSSSAEGRAAGSARRAPLEASPGESRAGQPGTNSDAVADGLEGSILDADGPQGAQQSRVQAASEGVDEGPAAGDERRVFDL